MIIEEFIDRSNAAQTLDDLVCCYSDAIGQFGFDRFAYSLCTRSAQLGLGKYPGLVHTYPQDWMDRYAENSYIDHDPVYKKSITLREAFSWSDLGALSLSKKERTIMDERKEAGINNGISVLIRGPLEEIVGLSVANDRADEIVDKGRLSRLFILMQQFHLRFVDLTGHPLVLPTVEISDREREVLVWASQGKSNGDIASIIGVSKKTVEFHFSSIFKKLHVNNRVLAILQGIYLRLIAP